MEPVDVKDLIPQKDSMRVVDKLVYDGGREAHISITVPEDSLFVDENGLLDEVVFLEMVAQSVAAHVGFENAQSGQESAEGFLLGCKNFKIMGAAEAGDELLIKIFKEIHLGSFGIVNGLVYKGKKLIASGEIKLWSKKEFV